MSGRKKCCPNFSTAWGVRIVKCLLTALFACMVATLSSPACAAENPQRLFWHIKKEARNLHKAQLIVSSELPSSSPVFSSMTEEEGCTVYVNGELAHAATSSQLAIMLGHELAHCVLGHHALTETLEEPERALKKWEFEYEADAMSLKLTRRLDLDTRAAFIEVLSLLPDDAAHPSGRARIRALQGGERDYPVSPIIGADAAAVMGEK